MLKLREEYKDTIVCRNIPQVGLVTFNTKTTPVDQYYKYQTLGFDFCFYTDTVQYKAPVYYKNIENTEPKVEENKQDESLVNISKKKKNGTRKKKKTTETEEGEVC